MKAGFAGTNIDDYEKANSAAIAGLPDDAFTAGTETIESVYKDRAHDTYA